MDDIALRKTGIGQFSLITDFGKGVLPAASADLDTTWEGPIHEFLTRHAGSRPNQPAIFYNGRVITYKQLGKPNMYCSLTLLTWRIGKFISEEQSNRVAHYLLKQNVCREQPVVIYGHRSPAVVVAILAILKAGTIYDECTVLWC